MKRNRKSVAAMLLCAMMLLGFTACTPSAKTTKYTNYSFDYFDTVTSVTGYDTSKESFDKTCEEIFSMLWDYHRLYNIYFTYEGMNNLCSLNRRESGAGEPVSMDARVIDLLLFAKEMYAVTEGKTNIALGSVLSIWHDYRTNGADHPEEAELPPPDRLLAASAHTNIEDLVIDCEAGTVRLADPEMTLDVGAIAKGYAVEQIARALEAQGVSGYILNVGGNVRTIGTRGDGSKWAVGIENSGVEDAGDYLAVLSLAGESLVTSGSYQRYYIVDGERYHHIIDPETLMPSTGYLSVSVVCGDSGFADALSTALFCLPFERGYALVESLSQVEVMWVFPDGERRYSSGFHQYVS